MPHANSIQLKKIRIVLDGLKGEDSIAELCRREGIAQSLNYSWSKEFLKAGKKLLAEELGIPKTTFYRRLSANACIHLTVNGI